MNNNIFFFFYSFAHQSILLDGLIVFFAVYFSYFVIILVGLFILFHHEVLGAESPARVFWEKKREIIFVVLPGCVAWVLAAVLKVLIENPRPFLALNNVNSLFIESDPAFPSGHATFFAALAFSIFFLHKKAGYIFMLFALFIGLARIMAGVHYPFDILGGYILGFLISYVFDYFLKKYSRIQ